MSNRHRQVEEFALAAAIAVDAAAQLAHGSGRWPEAHQALPSHVHLAHLHARIGMANGTHATVSMY